MSLKPYLLLSAGLLSSCALFWPQPDPNIAPACRDPAYRQFDFWIGEWDVLADTAGSSLAINKISRMAQGCALLERYATESGFSGKSLNWYEPTTRQWRQTWVDNSGVVLELAGGLDATGRMVLQGGVRYTEEAQAVLDRLSWTPLPDGSVRQVWELSENQGKTWEVIFSGLYRLRPPPAPVPTVDDLAPNAESALPAN